MKINLKSFRNDSISLNEMMTVQGGGSGECAGGATQSCCGITRSQGADLENNSNDTIERVWK